MYFGWAKRFPPDVEVVAIQLPGRGTRLAEPLLTEMTDVTNAVFHGLLPELDRPFLLFGHSLGGLIAFELARKLNVVKLSPRHLFVSGVRAADRFRKDNVRRYVGMSDEALINDIKQLGGTPDEMFENEELLELILPPLRADYAVIDSYRFVEGEKLRCDITAMAGLDDRETPEASIQGWSALTLGEFTAQWYPGDHFFLHPQEETIVQDIYHRIPSA